MSWSLILNAVIEAIKAAPTLIDTGKDLIEGAQKMWESVTAENPPTEAQQAEYDKALQEAHDALQKS